MDSWNLVQQSGRLLSWLDNQMWDASIAQDHDRYHRLDRLWSLAHKRHTRRYNEYQQTCGEPTDR